MLGCLGGWSFGRLGGRPNMVSPSQKCRDQHGTPLPTRGEGLGWGIIFLKDK